MLNVDTKYLKWLVYCQVLVSLQLSFKVRRSLKQKNKKTIYLSKEFSENKRQHLKTMAESANATVVDEKENATHLIYPAPVNKVLINMYVFI